MKQDTKKKNHTHTQYIQRITTSISNVITCDVAVEQFIPIEFFSVTC